MSNHLRDDNECQNCGYTVDKSYCSKCGQKNTETRQPFHHLFTHFIEDLTHYDGAFWKTIGHLLLRPAKLTREYLIGRRQTYVPPVKLYIFVSFVTFFILSLLIAPEKSHTGTDAHSGKSDSQYEDNNAIAWGDREFRSVKDLEEQEKTLPEGDRLSYIERWIVVRLLDAEAKNITEQQLIEGLVHTLPKVLFLYMPLFAFWLWLFHGKKRWYFFDHGIFTLHYFSFLLLLITIYLIITIILKSVLTESIVKNIASFISLPLMLYAFFYFFRSHRKMYCENKWMSRLKSLILFFINFILIFFAMLVATFYTVINIH